MSEVVINRSAPNLLAICVDETGNGDLSGRIVHRYTKTDIAFSNTMSMLRKIDDFFSEIDYPQTTERIRDSFEDPLRKCAADPDSSTPAQRMTLLHNPSRSVEELLSARGKKETFLLTVTSRANATWQGQLLWVEKAMQADFVSMMEILALLNNTLGL